MIPVTDDVRAVLDSGAAWFADLYTIRLLSGETLRITSADINVHWDGQVWQSPAQASVPAIERGEITFEIGLTVDQLSITLDHSPDMLLSGMPWAMAIRVGLLDAADVELVRAVGHFGSGVVAGVIPRFTGKVGPTDPGRARSTVTVDSLLAYLRAPVPRNLYQPSCGNTVYDSACGLNRASRETHVTVTSVSPDGLTVGISGATLPANKFQAGFARFTGLGSNVAQEVTVWGNTSSVVTLLYPFPAPLLVGQTLALAPGCSKSMDACQALDAAGWKNRFRGHPHVPVPETTL